MEERATIDELRKILSFYARGYKVPPIIEEVLYKVAKAEVEDKKKMVLIKRDPNIERNRIQSAYVKVVMGNAIELHPATVSGFGADFDGDQVGIYALLTEESQREALKMLSVTRGDAFNAPNMALGKEAFTGLFTLTYRDKKNEPIKVSSFEECEKLDIGQRVNFYGYNTTAGRVIFSSILPEYMQKKEYLSNPYTVTKKKIDIISKAIISKSQKDFVIFIDKAMKMGFKYSTLYPDTIATDMLIVPPELKKLAKEMEKEKDLVKQSRIQDQLTDKMMEHLRVNQPELYEHIESGAAKDKSQMRQCMIAKGLIRDSNGEILPPISKSLAEGFTPEEYFNSSHGSRKGIIDRAYNTANGGYTYRTAVFLVGNVQADINIGNCGTKRTLNIKLTDELFKRLTGRYVQIGDKAVPIDKSMIGSFINLRSPIYCKNEKICRTCYGDLIKQLDTRNAGIVAASSCLSLSEKIMKCSSGLLVSDQKIVSFEDLWENSSGQ